MAQALLFNQVPAQPPSLLQPPSRSSPPSPLVAEFLVGVAIQRYTTDNVRCTVIDFIQGRRWVEQQCIRAAEKRRGLLGRPVEEIVMKGLLA